jgi:hypothetical protein
MKTNKKELAEVVGIFAIVASLIFVGMQLRLERKVAMAEQYFNRAETVKEDYRTALLSPEYFRYVEAYWALTGKTPYGYSAADWEEMAQVKEGTLSISNVETMVLLDRLQIVGYDNLYFQYKQGLLDEATWTGLRSSLKSSMANNKLTSDVFYYGARATLKPVIDDILKEIESEKISN